MRSNLIQKRVAKLEHSSVTSDAVLRFADGSVRAVTIKKPLKLLCAAMDRTSFYLGPPEGMDRSADFDYPAPRPVSRYDGLIDLFAMAESIETGQKFLHTIWGACRQAGENGKMNPSQSAQKFAQEQKAQKSDAPPDGPDVQGVETQ